MDAHRIFSRRFFTEEKIKPRSYRTYSQRFRKEKRRFGNYHEVLLYFLLFVVKKKFSYIFLKHQKTVFTTPLTRNTSSTNIFTNIFQDNGRSNLKWRAEPRRNAVGGGNVVSVCGTPTPSPGDQLARRPPV